MGWGSGTANFTYIVTVCFLYCSVFPKAYYYSWPLDAIQTKARKFHTTVDYLLDDFNLPRAGNIAIRRSAALVFVSADSGEDYITVDGNEGDR
jgi:hypothetical protein